MVASDETARSVFKGRACTSRLEKRDHKKIRIITQRRAFGAGGLDEAVFNIIGVA